MRRPRRRYEQLGEGREVHPVDTSIDRLADPAVVGRPGDLHRALTHARPDGRGFTELLDALSVRTAHLVELAYDLGYADGERAPLSQGLDLDGPLHDEVLGAIHEHGGEPVETAVTLISMAVGLLAPPTD